MNVPELQELAVGDAARIDEAFDELRSRFRGSELSEPVVVHWRVFAGDGRHVYELRIAGEVCEIGAPSDQPRFTVTCTLDTLVRLVAGELTPSDALFSRKLHLAGDLTLATMFEEIFDRGRPSDAEVAERDAARFVSFDSREYRSILTADLQLFESIQVAKGERNGRAGLRWRGLRCLKDPLDMALYPMLLWELRPSTVIELGSFEGGSALWLADVLQAFQVPARVISYDIRPDPIQATHPLVEFRWADVSRPWETLDRDSLATMPHPWFVMEDTHVNVAGQLEYFHDLLVPGDYVVVEDTCEPHTYRELKRFLAGHADEYAVDTHYTDNFGYNATWSWNSILVRR